MSAFRRRRPSRLLCRLAGFLLCLPLIACGSFTACGGEGGDSASDAPPKTPDGEVVHGPSLLESTEQYLLSQGAYTLLRRCVYSRADTGEITVDSYSAEERLLTREIYTPEGLLLSSASYAREDDRTVETAVVRYCYDDGGRCVSEEQFEGDRLLSRVTRRYDEKGNLLSEQYEALQEESLTTQYRLDFLYTYDEAGRIVRKEQHRTPESEDAEDEICLYAYDEQGRLLREARLRYEREYYVTEYDYDGHGNLVAERHLEDGVLQNESSVALEYDGDGRVVQRTTGGGSYRSRFAYDEQGHCVLTENYAGDALLYRGSFGFEYSGGCLVKYTQQSQSFGGETVLPDVASCTLLHYKAEAGLSAEDAAAYNRQILAILDLENF